MSIFYIDICLYFINSIYLCVLCLLKSSFSKEDLLLLLCFFSSIIIFYCRIFFFKNAPVDFSETARFYLAQNFVGIYWSIKWSSLLVPGYWRFYVFACSKLFLKRMNDRTFKFSVMVLDSLHPQCPLHIRTSSITSCRHRMFIKDILFFLTFFNFWFFKIIFHRELLWM